MKNKSKKTARVHADLGQFDLSVSSFGEIERTLDIDKLNKFLDHNVEDKKLSADQLGDVED